MRPIVVICVLLCLCGIALSVSDAGAYPWSKAPTIQGCPTCPGGVCRQPIAPIAPPAIVAPPAIKHEKVKPDAKPIVAPPVPAVVIEEQPRACKPVRAAVAKTGRLASRVVKAPLRLLLGRRR